jgi:diguanylate cyclase (GGDEF)-like protein/PAS domain S-box-containing protein
LILGGFSVAFGGISIVLHVAYDVTYILLVLPLWSAFYFSRRFSFALLALIGGVFVWWHAVMQLLFISHLPHLLLPLLITAFILLVGHELIDQHNRDLKAVERLKEQYRIVADYSHDFEGWLDQNNRWRYLSPASEEVTGYPAQAFLRDPALFEQIILPEDRPLVAELRQKAAASPEQTHRVVHRIRHKDDGIRWVEHTCRLIEWKNEHDKRRGWRISLRDITEEKLAKAALEESEQRYRDLVQYQGEGLVVADEHQTFLFSNPAADALLGIPPGGLIGSNLREFVAPEALEKLEQEVEKRRRGLPSTYDLEVVRADGERRTFLITAVPYLDHRRQFVGTIATFRDITRRKERENRLEYESTHDMLTGIYNRAFFETRLKEMQADPPLPVSILMIDVNELKTVNDTLGHGIGDQYLRRVAYLLKTSSREADDIVARYGGDEFVVLLPRLDEKAVQRVSERIQQAIERENQSGQNPFQIDLSIGAATCPAGGCLETAFHEADQRMYAIKRAKKERQAVSSSPARPLKQDAGLSIDASP